VSIMIFLFLFDSAGLIGFPKETDPRPGTESADSQENVSGTGLAGT
jgi:hypothetical protein